MLLEVFQENKRSILLDFVSEPLPVFLCPCVKPSCREYVSVLEKSVQTNSESVEGTWNKTSEQSADHWTIFSDSIHKERNNIFVCVVTWMKWTDIPSYHPMFSLQLEKRKCEKAIQTCWYEKEHCTQKKINRGLPWWSSGEDCAPRMQGAGFYFLVMVYFLVIILFYLSWPWAFLLNCSAAAKSLQIRSVA